MCYIAEAPSSLNYILINFPKIFHSEVNFCLILLQESRNCVELLNDYDYAGKWNDVSCKEVIAYMCEKDLGKTHLVNIDSVNSNFTLLFFGNYK